MLNEDLVRTAYRQLLNRAPENTAVLIEKMYNVQDKTSLIQGMIDSDEFMTAHRHVLLKLFG